VGLMAFASLSAADDQTEISRRGCILKLVMGSCRLAEPLKDHPECVLYPGGHVHSTSAFLQSIRIMLGELTPPAELEAYLFRGWGLAGPKTVDFRKVDSVLLELCSIKNYMYEGWVLHIGYEDNTRSGELQELPGVSLQRETPDEMMRNLDTLGEMLGSRGVVVFLQNNIPQIPERYLLGSVGAQWCRQRSHPLIDATAIIAKHGMAACLPMKDGQPDYQHYTEYMKLKVLEAAITESTTKDSAVAVSPRLATTEAVRWRKNAKRWLGGAAAHVGTAKRAAVRLLRLLGLKPGPRG